MADQDHIWTVGHSNRSLEAFIELLTAHEIELVDDVRRFPGSNTHPHFARQDLRLSLAGVGISYYHFPALGGRRGPPASDSPNTAWRVASFAGYADYMQTSAFNTALYSLVCEARIRQTAGMCAEALPWRCHRRLICDALVIQGWQVNDILGPNKTESHKLTAFCRMENNQISYPADALDDS